MYVIVAGGGKIGANVTRSLLRLGSATGVAVVICSEPAQCEYLGGVQRQRIWPFAASIASVIPYVVVTKNASWVAPRTDTPCR